MTTLFDPVTNPVLKKASAFTLRPYQEACVSAIRESLQSSRSTLAVLPTGCGKTVIFGSVINEMEQGRALVIAHRAELIYQAAEKIRNITQADVAIEMAGQWSDEWNDRHNVVVSTVQSQIAGRNGGRMCRFFPNDFNLLVIDEAHHAVADSYKKVIDYYCKNPNLKVLGVTATPDRADEAALGKVFDSVAYQYEIIDAINDGWLVNVLANRVNVNGLDFSHVRTTAGDLNEGDLAAEMERESILHGIATPTVEIANGRKSLVFASSLNHAGRLTEIFNRHRDGSARFVHGGTPELERRKMFEDYRAGRFQFLVNVGVATEGFDDPSIAVVVMARPTKSRALFAQMAGRGTRPLPGLVDGIDDAFARVQAIKNSAKPNVEIVDFVGNAGRHKLVGVADVLGGKYEDDVVDRVDCITKDRRDGKPVDVVAELDRVQHQHREAEERKRRSKIVARVNFTTHVTNPFDVFDIEPRREPGWHRGRQPTPKQLAFLAKSSIPTDNLTFFRASQLIDEQIRRRNEGLSTYKQAKLLAKYGVDASAMSFKDASAQIDAIAKRGWRA